MRLRIVLFTLLLAALAGCNRQGIYDRFMPKAEDAFARSYLALFPAHDFASIETKLDPSLKGPQLQDQLSTIMAVFPAGKPISIKTVGAGIVSEGGVRRVNLSYEYAYPGIWLLANIALREEGGTTRVTGVHVQRIGDSLEHANRFTFDGKGARYFAMFGLAILIPLFIVVALVLCVRTPIPKRKWLWFIFILFGVAQLSLDWTSGHLAFSPLYVELLGASFIKPSPYAPVYLAISFPLGAVIFLLRRRKWMRGAAAGDDGDTA